MRSFLYLKLIFLLLTLVGVIYVMTHMNSDAVSRALAAFGVEAGTPESPGLMAAGRPVGEGEMRSNICPNRVQSIAFGGKDGAQIFERDRKWLALDGTSKAPRELAYMEIEKWFSQHCQIVIREVDGEKSKEEKALAAITIQYIDGSERIFAQIPGGNEFVQGTLYFESQDFADALSELKRIAQIP